MGEFRDNHYKFTEDMKQIKKENGKTWKVNPACTPYFWDLLADAVERRRTGLE